MRKGFQLLIALLVGIIIAIIIFYLFQFIKNMNTQFPLLYYILLLAYRIVFLIVFFLILGRSENPYTKLPWLIALILAPEIGLALYLSFAFEYKSTLRYKKRKLMHGYNYLINEPESDLNTIKMNALPSNIYDIFRSSANMTKHKIHEDDTKVTVLTNGDKAFPALIESLENAEKYIYMEYFIVKTDDIGQKVLNILRKKAQDGLDVKLLYDAMGYPQIDKKYLKGLEVDGVQVVATDPVLIPIFNSKINYRNHRKITIVDGQIGFTGGLNLGDEYNHNSPKFGFWRDTNIQLDGLAVNSLLSVFLKDWYYATGDFITDDKYYCAKPVPSDGFVQVIQSGPDSLMPYIRNVYVKMFNEASRSIKIMSPYLALDPEISTALKIAALSGIKVQIIVPGKPDHKYVYMTTKSYFSALLEAGVEIYQYKDTFTHGKIVIIDEIFASCGSFNMDYRSFTIDFEDTVLLYNESAHKLHEDFLDDLTHCEKVDYNVWKNRSHLQKLGEGILNIIAPLS